MRDDHEITFRMTKADKEQANEAAYYLDPPLPPALQALVERALETGLMCDWVRFCLACEKEGPHV